MKCRIRILITFISLLLLFHCVSARKDAAAITDFGLSATSVSFYYRDLAAAETFYTSVLGLEKTADYGSAKILRVARDSYIMLVDAARGMHSEEEPKTVAIALLTDRLEQWYRYLENRSTPMRFRLSASPGKPHDGFVAIDPEGYLLEFERFNQHPENRHFLPILKTLPRLPVSPKPDAERPRNLSFHGMITWMYYRDIPSARRFYETALGLPLLVDQGWAFIYHATGSGYIGLVDGKRGMHSWTESKAVNVGFIMKDVRQWFARVKKDTLFPLRADTCFQDPAGRFETCIGYDPGGYYLEFDRFFTHDDNHMLMEHLEKAN